uniref:F5/8 type C domain-containing protein n=1 Tax=Globisporangium ultimum (strain ATCC 200006 / CBS 805.95 / DAOM BR144) TaxID=431595 RepID=K3WCF4_GLOUD
MGEAAHASSYYDYKPNVLLDAAFVPENALDGFAGETSWWSAGDNRSEEVFWQVNLTTAPPPLARIVIRWHGFQTPAQYRIRVSRLGESFQTIAVMSGKSIEYDRVDIITEGLDKATAARFKFLRVTMETANVCSDASVCEDPTTATAAAATNERVIYGIREFELWAKGTKSDATTINVSTRYLRWITVLVAALAFS